MIGTVDGMTPLLLRTPECSHRVIIVIQQYT